MRDLLADNDRRERVAVGKSCPGQTSDAIGNVHLGDTGVGEGIPADSGDGCRQSNGVESGTIGKHIVSEDVVRRRITLVVSLATTDDTDICKVEFPHLSCTNLFAKELDVGTIDEARQLERRARCSEEGRERACRRHMNGICRPAVRREKTGDADQHHPEKILKYYAFHNHDINVSRKLGTPNCSTRHV